MPTSLNIVIEVLGLIRKEASFNATDASTPLIGASGVLDSMKLVELCLALEDKAEALGFQFDWTSDKAMSEHVGMFRTVQSLTDEFDRQMRLAGKASQ